MPVLYGGAYGGGGFVFRGPGDCGGGKEGPPFMTAWGIFCWIRDICRRRIDIRRCEGAGMGFVICSYRTKSVCYEKRDRFQLIYFCRPVIFGNHCGCPG